MKNEIDNHFSPKTHNGFVTVENSKTGDHRTFKIETKDFGKGENSAPKRVVSLLVGPDRDSFRDWKGFGFVQEDGSISVWKKCRGENGERSSFEKFSAILTDRSRGENSGLVYMLEGRCRRCNRPLTNPESIRTGIGPICSGAERAESGELSHAEKVQAAWNADRAREDEAVSEHYSAARHSIIFAG